MLCETMGLRKDCGKEAEQQDSMKEIREITQETGSRKTKVDILKLLSRLGRKPANSGNLRKLQLLDLTLQLRADIEISETAQYARGSLSSAKITFEDCTVALMC